MNELTEPPDALETSAWADASLAAAMLAVDPVGLGGALIKGHPGPVRDQWLELLKQYLPAGAPFRKIPSHIKEDRLLGGLDLTATLHSGRPVGQQGLLAQAHGGVAVLAMAERVSNTVAALIGAAIDTGEVVTEREGITMRSQAKFGLIALDEGVDDDEEVSSCLTERLAIVLDLKPIGVQEVFGSAVEVGAADISSMQLVLQARRLLPDVRTDRGTVRALCAAAWALGIRSARTPLLAGRVARVSAALDGRVLVNNEDAAAAARLVLAPRALIAFSAEQTPPQPEANTDLPPDLEPPSPDGRDADPEEQPDQQMDSQEHDSVESAART